MDMTATLRIAFVLSLVLVVASLGACAPGASHLVPVAAKGRTPTSTASPRSLAVRLVLDARGLHVVVRASSSGSDDDLRVWKLGAAAVTALEVRDANGGAVPFEVADRTVTLPRPEASPSIAYDVAPASFREDPAAAIVEEARFRGAGESLFALPKSFESGAFAFALDIDGRAIDAPVVASSLGAGAGSVHSELRRATADAVRRVAILGGGGGHVAFDAPEGHDVAAWIGYAAFDPRPMAAEVAVFRGMLRDHFRSGVADRATLLLAIDERAPRRFRVQRRTGGLFVAASGADPFDAPLRLAVAHELVHSWIGDRLWIGDPRPGHEAESIWFHEGYARWTAREQLYRSGLLSPEEYSAEVNRLLSIVTTSRHARRPLSELVLDARAGVPGIVPLLVARGALHATLVDARIRAGSSTSTTPSSGTPASLNDVLRELLREIEVKPHAISDERWHAALAAQIGPARERADHEEVIVAGTRVSLPPDALGACFEAHEASYDIFDPGFDVTASLDEKHVRGIRASGPAAKAGLREGEPLAHVVEPATPTSKMKVEIERDGKSVVVEYRASAGARRGQAFRRRAGLSDDACRKLALRH